MEEEDRAGITNCLHCGNAAILEARTGDFREYRCPDCGAYHVTDTFRKLIDNGRVRSPCIVELLNGRRLLADREDLPMGSRVG
jgi:hypothetical protein